MTVFVALSRAAPRAWLAEHAVACPEAVAVGTRPVIALVLAPGTTHRVCAWAWPPTSSRQQNPAMNPIQAFALIMLCPHADGSLV